jgi:uncharacterized membrane protein
MSNIETENRETDQEQDDDGNGNGGVKEAVSRNGGGSLLSSLATKEVVIPVAASAAAAAATYMARKGPDLLKDTLMPKLEEKGKETAKEATSSAAEGVLDKAKDSGGVTGVAANLISKVAGKKGGGEPTGRGRGRRLPIQRWTDVAAPVETVYNQWTQFEEFPRIMHRVQSVQQQEDNKLSWEEKIWFSRRRWEAEITEQRPNERIAWKTVSGTAHTGVVSFHRLDDRLTRVLVNLDFQPSGMFEKMGSGMRFVKRAVQADLARFKAYVEMREEEDGAWRGRIEDGEVVEGAENERRGRKDEDGDRDRRRQRDSGRRRESRSGQRSSAGKRQSSNGKGDDADREAQRAEREARRESRRQRVNA